MTVREARLAALMRMRERRDQGGRMQAAMPVDPWRLVSRRFSAEGFGESETMFAVANGYMGMRGTHDEGVPSHDPAYFVNGFHETWPIPYGESAFGFATTGQTIVSAPDGSVMRLYVDEEPLVLSESKLLNYERVLDMRAGLLERSVTFRTARGAVVSLRSQRLVSLHWRHLAAISYEVTLVSGAAELAVASELVTHLPRPKGDDDPRVGVRMTDSALEPVAADLRRHARRARAAHAPEPDGPGVRHGAHDRDPAAPQRRVQRRGGRGPRRLLPRRRARRRPRG